MYVSVVVHGRQAYSIYSVYQAGRGHGAFRNSLIIRYHLNESVETQPFLGHVSTLCFVTI